MGGEVTILEEIERGPRAALYRGREAEAPGRPVILKVLEGEQATEATLQQLEHEGALGARLQTSAVVKAYRLMTHRGHAALVLEDFGGESLDKRLGRPMEVGAFLEMAIRIAQAVVEIHRLGVVHKDLKPSNIIVTQELAKLTDFGIAAVVASEGQVVARAGLMDGTPAYMSPEQTGRTNRGVDFRSDLYSLGVTFYEMLTGRLPFVARDSLEWVHSHIAKQPADLATLVPGLPTMLSELVARMLAKSVVDRYQTARGVLMDLLECKAQWDRARTIPPFPLSREDVADRFQVSSRLYGRGREVAALEAAFERTLERGAPVLVLLGGFSGIGKSSLVQELYRPVVRSRSHFISGKFDQFARDVPYSAVTQALEELFQRLLSFDELSRLRWKRQLQAAVGNQGRVILQVAPALEAILGPQPEVPELGSAEAQNRFHLVFSRFIGALASAEHPLVLFLDDVQWADRGTLELLNAWMTADNLGPVLFLLAFRDNEVDAAHPLHAWVQGLRRQQMPFDEVQLQALDAASLHQMVAETLRSSPEDSRALADVVFQKTEGNPFFASELLKALHRADLLTYVPERRGWTAKLDRLGSLQVTDNVVDLMISRLRRLPDAGQRALRLAACIGGTFSLATLATVSEQSRSETLHALQDAVDLGLVTPLPEESSNAGVSRRFRFQHDRIHQAAYALIDEGDRPAVHLKIGRLLLQELSAAEREARVFELVHQLNLGLPLLTDARAKAELLALNLTAARRAKASTAHGTLRKHLLVAAGLLPEDAWQTDAQRTFRIHLELAEAAYLCGDLTAAERGFRSVIERAQNLLERGSVWGLQMRLYQVAGDYERATALALESFAQFGLHVPATPEAAALAVGQEAARAVTLRNGRAIPSLVRSPRMEDEKAKVLMGLLEASGPPLYMVKPELFPWIALTMVNLSLERGHTEASCYGYGIYAILLAAAFGDVPAGHAFSQLAIALNEKFNDVKLRGCMLHLFGDHVNFWKRPLASGLPILEKGFAACVEGGDLIYSNYIGFQHPWHAWESGQSLGDVMALTQRYAAFARQTKHEAVFQTLRLEQQFLRNLQGRTLSRASFDDEDFCEAEAAAVIEAARFGCGIVYRHILKMISAFTFGDFDRAWESAQAAEQDLGAAFSMPMEISYHLYRALTAAGLLGNATPATRPALLEALASAELKFERWSKGCPANFEHKHALIAAEHARVRGRVDQAAAHYEVAIRTACEQQFSPYEALASELAAKFYAGLNVASVSSIHLRHAQTVYTKVGMTGKVRQLEGDFGGLISKRSVLTLTPSSGASAHELDMLSVLRLSQTISGEMELPSLLETLIRIVVESAGAERGILLLVKGDALEVAAEYDVNRAAQRSRGSAPSEGNLALSIVDVVRRTQRHVLLEDASTHRDFAADAYLAKAHPRSVLCLPVVRHSELKGVFYLENNLVPGVFGADRLAVLELLAAQVAISVDNSRLYAAAQDATRLRDEFLSIASHELKTPLTPLKLHLERLMGHLRQGTLHAMPPESVGKMLQSADRQIVRLRRLVEDLLDVTGLTAGKLPLTRGALDLAALARDVVGRQQAAFASAGCALSVEAPGVIEGNWDRQRVEQVLLNLLANALKFGNERPVRVIVRDLGARAALEVQDLGPGLAAEDLVRIFDRFERVRSADNVGGLGLGLYIVRQIVEAHGGTVEVESTPGKGASFRVELPKVGA